ncbi:hypothetical protein ABK040_005158 [Willaertia magna]
MRLRNKEDEKEEMVNSVEAETIHPMEKSLDNISPTLVGSSSPEEINREKNNILLDNNNIFSDCKFPLKSVIIGTRKTSILLSNGGKEDRSLLISIFNLLRLRGTNIDIPPHLKELSLDQLLFYLEKAFIEFNDKLKRSKIRSVLVQLCHCRSVDFYLTEGISGIKNKIISKLAKWVKIYFVHGIIIGEEDPMYNSLKGMKYSELLHHSSFKLSRKHKDIQNFLKKNSELRVTKYGLQQLHHTEQFRLKILYHEDRYSVIVNYKGRIFELIDPVYYNNNPQAKQQYLDCEEIPEEAVWLRWPLYCPEEKRILCYGDFFAVSPESLSPRRVENSPVIGEEPTIEESEESNPVVSSDLITSSIERDVDVETITCPISMMIFMDPVVAVDNRTYERETFKRWCAKKSEIISPVTGQKISTKVVNDVVIRNKAKLYIERRIYLKLSDELYCPKYNFDNFRKYVKAGNIEEVEKLIKDDIRLIVMSPTELKEINDLIENEDNLTGYNYAYSYGNLETLEKMRDVITQNLSCALEQGSDSGVSEKLSQHLDQIEQKIDSLKEFNILKTKHSSPLLSSLKDSASQIHQAIISQ